MAKEFKKSFMHRTRKKLVDMVHTGEYTKDTTTGWTKKEQVREIGDTWEDEFNRYEQRKGYVLKTSKNSEAFQEVRDYLQKQNTCNNEKCKTVKKSQTDKKLIKKSGYCLNCTVEREHEIRVAGLWSEYENYKIWTRMIVDGKLRLEQIRQAHDELKQQHEYVNEDGTLDVWVMPQPVEEVKAGMIELITNGTEEIKEIELLREEAFNKLKEQNFEHYI